jgi:hypothetical protein
MEFSKSCVIADRQVIMKKGIRNEMLRLLWLWKAQKCLIDRIEEEKLFRSRRSRRPIRHSVRRIGSHLRFA